MFDQGFSSWVFFSFRSYEGVEVNDIALKDYMTVNSKKIFLPHSAGRWNIKRFRKAQCPLIERLTNSLMMHGRNNGKKLMAVRIVKHTFEIINLLTSQNPLQIFVDAVTNSGPREDSTRVGSGGTARRQAVDVSPIRRVNQAIYFLTQGVCIFLLFFFGLLFRNLQNIRPVKPLSETSKLLLNVLPWN